MTAEAGRASTSPLRQAVRFVFWLVLRTLEIGLIVLLLLQFLLLFAFWRYDEVKAPLWLKHQINSRLETSGIHADAAEIIITPDARITLRDITLSLENERNTVSRIGEISADFEWSKIIRGSWIPSDISVRNAEILSPPLFSSSGVAAGGHDQG